PDGRLDDVLQRAAGERQRLLDVVHRPARLRLDAARHDLAVVAHRDLARDEDERTRADGGRERQWLAACAGADASQEFDSHHSLRSTIARSAQGARPARETKLQST